MAVHAPRTGRTPPPRVSPARTSTRDRFEDGVARANALVCLASVVSLTPLLQRSFYLWSWEVFGWALTITIATLVLGSSLASLPAARWPSWRSDRDGSAINAPLLGLLLRRAFPAHHLSRVVAFPRR